MNFWMRRKMDKSLHKKMAEISPKRRQNILAKTAEFMREIKDFFKSEAPRPIGDNGPAPNRRPKPPPPPPPPPTTTTFID